MPNVAHCCVARILNLMVFYFPPFMISPTASSNTLVCQHSPQGSFILFLLSATSHPEGLCMELFIRAGDGSAGKGLAGQAWVLTFCVRIFCIINHQQTQCLKGKQGRREEQVGSVPGLCFTYSVNALSYCLSLWACLGFLTVWQPQGRERAYIPMGPSHGEPERRCFLAP